MQTRLLRFALGCSLALAGASSLGTGSLCSPRPAAAAEGEDDIIALARDLELLITETGPEQPWTLHLHNRGNAPIGIMADPGLLWFEVEVPGIASPRVCRLPEPLWPSGMRRRSAQVLPPGERFSRRFDPRFFCFSDIVQTTLVPGAKVTPHFGWPHVGVGKAGGKAQNPPQRTGAGFVAWAVEAPPPPPPAEAGEASEEASEGAPLEASEEGADTSDGPAAGPWQPPTEGLENITGASVVLSPPYAKWSERAAAPAGTINVALLAGSDAEDERAAVVTVGIGNGASVPQTVVVRRELLSFSVLGPDGPFECPPGELGSPDVASFTTLGPRASDQLVVRLIEMCDRGGFSRPGVYEVRATYHGRFSGQALGLDAFVGEVSSARPALVRVRSGERASFVRVAPMVAGGDGPAAAAPAAAPAPDADGHVIEGPEAPAEEQPAESNPALDNGPPPESPAPDGTSVE
jgi:hypothetical protein